MAYLTPRHVIEAYHELVLLDEATTRMLNGALLELKAEQDRHKKTKRKLLVAQEETERLEHKNQELRGSLECATNAIDVLTEEKQRSVREIQILRSQI